MRLQWNGTSAVTVKVQPNTADVVLQPGNVIDIPSAQYQSIKDQFGALFTDVGNDATIQMAVKSITTAQVLALNTTPLAIIPAPGAGYAIEVLSAVGGLTYNSVAYATNLGLDVRYDNAVAGDGGGSSALGAPLTSLLDATASKIQKVNSLGAAVTTLTQNKGVSVIVNTGNPTAGNSGIKVRVYYRIVSVA